MAAPSYTAVLERIQVMTDNVRSFRVRFQNAPAFAFKAGQFMIVNVPKDGKTVKRAYSIASSPYDPGVVEFCIQHLEGGIASTYFWNLKEGDALSISGPHGNFVLRRPVDYDVVFMATGTGVAPLRSMIHELFHQNTQRAVWLLFGTRYENALLYHEEFLQLAAQKKNFHYIPTISRPQKWPGATGHIQQTFQKTFSPLPAGVNNKQVYLCGWLEVIKAICNDLSASGVPREQLHYEEWG